MNARRVEVDVVVETVQVLGGEGGEREKGQQLSSGSPESPGRRPAAHTSLVSM